MHFCFLIVFFISLVTKVIKFIVEKKFIVKKHVHKVVNVWNHILLIITQRKAHLQQHRCKDLSHSLIEGVNGRFQHRWHKKALVKVVLCDHCGMQLEENQHLLSPVTWSFNLTKGKNALKLIHIRCCFFKSVLGGYSLLK